MMIGWGAEATLTSNTILSNTAASMLTAIMALFYDNLAQGNVASQGGDGTGGGIWAQYLKEAERNTILDNRASRGGGIYYTDYSGSIALRDNLIALNYTDGSASDPPDGGGGIYSLADQVEIVDNRILTNTAYSGAGGGILTAGGSDFALQDNQIISNTVLAGGGMYLWGSAQPALESNVVMSNTALGFFNPGGSGILINIDAGLPLTLTNHIIA
ncbi:MAG TPA: hypothetical protein EYP90_05100, partial [Chromatiaceae bacterium]|nr:hypothetical protein [Chromatiaceae bacterium]